MKRPTKSLPWERKRAPSVDENAPGGIGERRSQHPRWHRRRFRLPEGEGKDEVKKHSEPDRALFA